MFEIKDFVLEKNASRANFLNAVASLCIKYVNKKMLLKLLKCMQMFQVV